jgi:transmembrane sensor
MNPSQQTPDEQADYWLALLHSPLATPAQQQAFQDWLAESQANRAAWTKAQTFWKRLDTLRPEQIAVLERRLGARGTPATAAPAAKQKRRRFIFPWSMPIMASLLLLLWVGIGPIYFADYRTRTGEQRSLQLSDGSTLVLNTASAVSVDFTAARRTVILHEGEVYFKVAKDADRPFEVRTENGWVRALGTAFDVKQQGEAMTVTVYEHAVRIAFSRGKTIERLQEGERAVSHRGWALPIERVNLKEAQTWREHRLVFKDMPLQRVVAELDRYRPGKIMLVNEKLGQHRVTGIFDPREPDAALTMIEATLHLAGYRLPGNLVFLVARTDSSR